MREKSLKGTEGYKKFLIFTAKFFDFYT